MQRRVGHFMTQGLLGVRPDEPVFRALEVMAEQRVRHVLVLEDGELKGIVSNRDVIRSAMGNAEKKLDLHGCTIGSIMTRAPLETVGVMTSLGEAASTMHRNRISALPVMDEGRVTGILTADDVLTAVAASE
mgnify:CR=1 FL=1